MIRPIVKDIFFLRQKSEPATKADAGTAKDLMDTLAAHKKDSSGFGGQLVDRRMTVWLTSYFFQKE